jgi:hypothetical protein
MKTWDYRRFGSPADPIRQSALGAFASQDGCGRRYRYERDAEAAGIERERTTAHWRSTMGTAVHAVIERALAREPMVSAVLEGRLPSPQRVDAVLDEELVRAAEGRPIDWGDASEQLERATGRWMALGALRTVSERARRILAVEAPFLVTLDGYAMSGTIDLAYEPRGAAPGAAVALADWKTGERRPHQVVLDHGYQTGIYSHALAHGVLWPGTERETRLGLHPEVIHIVHLRSYATHERTRAVLAAVRESSDTSKELAVRVARRGWPVSTHAIAGALRALADDGLVTKKRVGKDTIWSATATDREPNAEAIWLESRRRPDDVARLRVSLKTIVGTVRMGRFVERLGEQCGRCPFRAACLGDGHVSTDTARLVERALDGLDLSGVIPDAA